jgi:hypothetical protein
VVTEGKGEIMYRERMSLRELAARVIAAPPATRHLRLMPVLLTFLAFYAQGLTLNALYLQRHQMAAIVFWVCVIVLWLIYRDDLRNLKKGQRTTADAGVMHWWLEWLGALLLSRIAISLGAGVFFSTSHSALPEQPSAIITTVTLGLYGAFVFTLGGWWRAVVRDLSRPSTRSAGNEKQTA